MKDETKQPQPQSDEDQFTIDEIVRAARFHMLTPEQQALRIRHEQDQFDAIPSYVERFRKNK